jgi:phytoene dehydrogenase-like protein
MKLPDKAVVIVGAGLAGISCARRLLQDNIPFLILEADERIGGRIKTDTIDGFILNHGFQVLQTAYPEAQRTLNYERLALRPFAPGAIIRIHSRFYHIADPMRRPRHLGSTLFAPIGTLADRLRMARLAFKVRRASPASIFHRPDMPVIDFLRTEGFSENVIQRFFKPFFAGVFLDPEIRASSRVFQYIFKIFAQGDVALPSMGMGAIVDQLAQDIPPDRIRTSARVASIHPEGVVLESGENIDAFAVVVATEGPEAARLTGDRTQIPSQGELCLYYSAEAPPLNEPYLILNGDGTGRINSLTVPSIVAPTYAPAGRHLISVVVIGHMSADDISVETDVREELAGWFGQVVDDWRHLKTYRISHALPAQPPPMPDPTIAASPIEKGIIICGEFGSVPGIQWAMLSGRRAAEQIIKK